MAFDGIMTAGIVQELREKTLNSRIYKIYQPEPDELSLILKTERGTRRLLLSASAALPFVYLTTESRKNPMTAPSFCMLLRKHIGNGRITAIEQMGLDRIICIRIEHLDEMGDLCIKKLIIEIMGKHSNLIFCDDEDRIIDSIKRIGAQISSVREVLPGRLYEQPPGQGKADPLTADRSDLEETVLTKPVSLTKALYTSYTGLSPVAAQEICWRAGLDGDGATARISEDPAARDALWTAFSGLMRQIGQGVFEPGIYYDGQGYPVECSAVALHMYDDMERKRYESLSQMLQAYYEARNRSARLRQRSSDLRHTVNTLLERTAKKYDLQRGQMKDTEKRERYQVYGELLHTYGYEAQEGDSSITVLNYYTNEELTIPLDPTLTAAENAQRYFARYNKLKRTWEALTGQMKQTERELYQLQSIQAALDAAQEEADLTDIRRELTEYGYIRGKSGNGKKERQAKSKPLHYVSADGYHMYVGKNNYQNEALTFHTANGGDLWFHAKQTPGSHVIVRTEGAAELPDATYEEAARLAAYYSSARTGTKVEVDYTRRSNLKKTPGGPPGFVIYHTNYSMTVSPDIRGIREADRG